MTGRARRRAERAAAADGWSQLTSAEVSQLLDDCCEPGCQRQALRWFLSLWPLDGEVEVIPVCLRHEPDWRKCRFPEFCDHPEEHDGMRRVDFFAMWPEIVSLLDDVGADLSIPNGHSGTRTRITRRQPS